MWLDRRTHRKGRASRLLGSWLFCRIFNYLTDLNYDGMSKYAFAVAIWSG
jgi:hypothetical protein